MLGKPKYKSKLMQSVDEALAATTAVLDKPTKTLALSKVVAMAKSAPTHDLALLEDALADRKAALDALFPIEAAAITKVKGQIKEIEEKHNIAKIASKYDGKYMPVSMEILSWRAVDGLPILALFSLKDPVFKMSSDAEYYSTIPNPGYNPALPEYSASPGYAVPTQNIPSHNHQGLLGGQQGMLGGYLGGVNYSNNIYTTSTASTSFVTYNPKTINTHGHISPAFPSEIEAMYRDVRDLLKKKAKEKRTNGYTATCRIGATFSGVIPDSTRAKIKEAQEVFKDIYILAEPVFKWEVELVPVPVDPVVLGWDGQQLWYVDDFDITPVEEAALLQGPSNI